MENPFFMFLVTMALVVITLILIHTYRADPSEVTQASKAVIYDEETIEIENCEYIFGRTSYGAVLAHKGNCNNTIHTNNN